jgi:hypothetical protein
MAQGAYSQSSPREAAYELEELAAITADLSTSLVPLYTKDGHCVSLVYHITAETAVFMYLLSQEAVGLGCQEPVSIGDRDRTRGMADDRHPLCSELAILLPAQTLWSPTLFALEAIDILSSLFSHILRG